MKSPSLSSLRPIGALVTALTLAALFFFTWSTLVGATPLQEGTPPLVSAAKGAPAGPSLPTVAVQAVAAEQRPVAAPLGPLGPGAAPLSRSPLAINCGGAAACNTVVTFDTRIGGGASQDVWETYSCMDTGIFSTLGYSETGYTFNNPVVQDVSLAVPLVMSDGVISMNVFAALGNSCGTNCLYGSENKNLTIYRHAIYTDAPSADYTAILDSDNMAGFGDLIIACGSGDPGWCAGQIRADITCNNYTINDTTEGGSDNIIYYDSPNWPVVRYAYDGPERVYRIVVSDPSAYHFTFHYPGSATLPYNNYMSYGLLDSTCDQRDLFGGPAYPEAAFVGEGTYTTTQSTHVLMPGTYYLVVDGMHMPTHGDSFELDIECAPVSMIYLPLVAKNHATVPTILSVNPASGPVETEFWFTGIGFRASETVSDWFTSPSGTRYDMGSFSASTYGSFMRGLQLTGPWPTGTYRYYARGAQSQQTASIAFRITASMAQFAMEEPQISFSVR